jgi:hypothetical protein
VANGDSNKSIDAAEERGRKEGKRQAGQKLREILGNSKSVKALKRAANSAVKAAKEKPAQTAVAAATTAGGAFVGFKARGYIVEKTADWTDEETGEPTFLAKVARNAAVPVAGAAIAYHGYRQKNGMTSSAEMGFGVGVLVGGVLHMFAKPAAEAEAATA